MAGASGLGLPLASSSLPVLPLNGSALHGTFPATGTASIQ